MIKGKTTIELTDIKTKEKTIYEDENIVTDAVYNLLSLNPIGLMYPIQNTYIKFEDELFPIATKCLGGVLLFEEPIEEHKEKYIPQSDNEVVGYASNDVNQTDNQLRGSFNLTESKKIDKGYKLVWDFSTSQANGKISSLALTHYKGGVSYYGDNYQKESLLKLNKVTTETEKEMIKRYLGVVERKDNTLISIFPKQDKTIELIKFEEPILSVGLSDNIITSTRKVDSTTIHAKEFFGTDYYWYKAAFHDGGDGYWYGFRTDHEKSTKNNLYRLKIKKEDNSVTYDKWVLEGVALGIVGDYSSDDSFTPKRTIHSVIKDGYLYIPKIDKTEIYKININNPVDVTSIKLGFKSKLDTGRNTGVYLSKVGDYIVGYDFIISKNGKVTKTKGKELEDMHSSFINLDPFYIAYGVSESYGKYELNKFLLLHTPYLGTINNLSTSVVKTADKTMKIIYTLTEEN